MQSWAKDYNIKTSYIEVFLLNISIASINFHGITFSHVQVEKGRTSALIVFK